MQNNSHNEVLIAVHQIHKLIDFLLGKASVRLLFLRFRNSLARGLLRLDGFGFTFDPPSLARDLDFEVIQPCRGQTETSGNEVTDGGVRGEGKVLP